MKYQRLTCLCLLTCLLAITTAHAQNSKEPLNISADKTLDWDRTKQTFTANGNALAAQGDVSIAAEKLNAAYKENKITGNDFDIHTMTATNNVVITSADNKAYGDKAVYDLTKEIAVMTGSNLRLITPEQTITAKDQFEYHAAAGKLIASGDAKIIRPTDTLRANALTAYLTNNEKGERVLDKMTAEGNVVITTPTEKVTGTYGTYNGKTKIAELTGGVTITKGPNILQGTRATVDMNTQISRIFGSPKTNGRVTGTFYPGSEKKEQ